MRGKDDSINNHTICIRITPAYAGKSCISIYHTGNS